mgnify:FL=1|tara:strand:- start:273 stop:569 length:297 start_codon:yes stop_codon:yes gene_type:complete
MQTTYFKHENDTYLILLNATWVAYHLQDQGEAISSLITEKMRGFYTVEEAAAAEKAEGEEITSDTGIILNNPFWTKQKEVSDEIMSDFASFETALKGA